MIVGLLMYGMTMEELDPLAVFFLVIGAADKPWLGSGQELGITFIGPPSGVMAASGGSRTWYFPLDFLSQVAFGESDSGFCTWNVMDTI